MQEHQIKRTEFGQERIDPREPEQQSIEMALQRFKDWLYRIKADDKEAIRQKWEESDQSVSALQGAIIRVTDRES